MKHYNSDSVRSFDGTTPTMGQRVFVDPSAVVLGDVVLGDDVSVWPQVAIRGDMHKIHVGPADEYPGWIGIAHHPCRTLQRRGVAFDNRLRSHRGAQGHLARLHHRRPGAGRYGWPS